MARKPPRQRPEKKIFVIHSDDEADQKLVTHFIREWRKHRGLTQQELAEKTAYTDGAISHIETGQSAYTQTFLEAIAKALDCKPYDLLQHEPKVASQKDMIYDMIASLGAEDTAIMYVIIEAFVRHRQQKT